MATSEMSLTREAMSSSLVGMSMPYTFGKRTGGAAKSTHDTQDAMGDLTGGEVKAEGRFGGR
eukprot:6048557-Pleurochrysis_carterae.AAC.2